jgi:histidinol-phosphatase
MTNSQLLKIAQSFVAKTDSLVREKWKSNLQIERKKDNTFVTEIDLLVERTLREAIEAQFPGHGIIGEELANRNPDAEYQWIIDPIDGTQNLARKIPTFGTVLGVHHKGVPLVGVISHPALDLTYYGAKGEGAFCNGVRLAIEDPNQSTLDENEIIYASTRRMFARSGEEEVLEKLLKFHPNTHLVSDVFGHTRTIQGSAGAMVEFNVRIWDIAATQVLVEEAGGVFKQVRKHDFPDRASLLSVVFGAKSIVEILTSQTV